jgi:regulator of cell morphogenesis and NO signaling
LVTERLDRSRVFEKFGIDYCCGGKKSLAEACAERNVSLEEVVNALTLADAQPGDATEADWTNVNLNELCQHIVKTYHQPLRNELPRLDRLARKVAVVHGQNHPELAQVQETFARLRAALEMHMTKEEMVLFPICVELEKSKHMPVLHCGSVNNPIRVMTAEHDDAGADMASMRKLTNEYAPPSDACGSYRALLDGLAHLETTMHEHVHKENHILFPRAQALESRLAGSHKT